MNHQTEKTVITIETFQRTVVHLKRVSETVRCKQCATESLMISPEEAVAHLQSTVREIFRFIEIGEIHFLESTTGGLLVCRSSLSVKFSKYKEK